MPPKPTPPPPPRRGGSAHTYAGGEEKKSPGAAAANGRNDATPSPGPAVSTSEKKPRRHTGSHTIEDPPSVDLQDVLDDKYQLLERLDEGGMGALFVAHNLALDVPVAIKVIRADLRAGESRPLAERLLQEARAAARLGHPAIVRMMDFGIAPNGDPYLVMELLEGEDLATALDQRGNVSPATAARILLPIAHALAAAHEQGIVHRDLKPENIFLSSGQGGQTQPKLIDFGIAKMPKRTTRRLTMLGDAMGTPDYMSPEQARGEDVDSQADIWGLSVILYEMVTGELPFEAPNQHAMLRAIIEDEPASVLERGVDDERFAAIVAKGLAKRKPERWQSMRELGTALAQWLIDQGYADDVSGASLRAAWLQPSGLGASADVLSSMPPPPLSEQPAVVVLPETEGRAELEAKPHAAASKSAAAAVRAARPARPALWPVLLLWLLALSGIAAAVTGYLGIPLPGVPTHLHLHRFW